MRQPVGEHLGVRGRRPARRRGRRRGPRGCGRCAGPGPRRRAAAAAAARSTRCRPGRRGPSLRWVCGSAPRGSRSSSTRALIRRISSDVVVGQPAARGSAAGRSAPRSGAAGRGRRRRRRRAAAPGPPRPPTTWRSRRRRSPGCAPAAPACPRGAGRRRPRSGGSPPGRASRRRSSLATAWAYDAATCAVDAGQRLVDEQHVGVAAVGQLEAAVATHRHDRDPGRRLVEPARAAHRLHHHAQRRLERGVGDAREPGARRRRRRRARTGRRRPGGTARAAGSPGPRAPGARRPSAARRWRSSPRPSPRRGGAEVAAEDPHALRLALEQVGGEPRGGQQPGQPLGDLALVAQRREVPRRAAERLADLAEPEQPGVGVRRLREPLAASPAAACAGCGRCGSRRW